jgi:hypothetical protein
VVLVDSEGKKEHLFYPDVRIDAPGREPAASASGTALADPETESEPISIRPFIREDILETDPEIRLVTSIELLSPSNKRQDSPGWELYLRKRQGILMGTANLVELDLLRGGTRMPMLDPWPTSAYTVLVFRKGVLPSCRAWPIHYHRPLPPIPVPLDKPDPDITLNLQLMIESIYARSRYYRSIDYTKPLTPPLSPDGAKLLEQIGKS